MGLSIQRVFRLAPAWFGLCCLSLFASQQHLRFERLSQEEGLSLSVVTSMLQDRTGYLWFGTQDGLNRYDGYEFTIFQDQNAEPGSLSDSFIRCMVEDRGGLIWIGTESGGLNFYNPMEGRFTNLVLFPGSDTGVMVTALIADPQADHTVWAGTRRRGLIRIQLGDNGGVTTQVFETHRGSGGQDVEPEIVKLHLDEDNANLLWVASELGLVRFDMETSQFDAVALTLPDDQERVRVTAIYEDFRHLMWIGTEVGLVSYNKRNGKQHYYKFRQDKGSSKEASRVRVILGEPGNEKYLWIGTDRGLVRLDREHNRFVYYRHRLNDNASISHDRITSLLLDRSGVLWIGTAGGGLNRFVSDSGNFSTYTRLEDGPGGLNENIVLAIHEDPTGVLWVGTAGGGLNRMDRDSGEVDHLLHKPGDPNSLSSNHIYAIHEDRSRRHLLWLGTDFGLNLYDRKHLTYTVYHHDDDDPNSLSHDRVFSLVEDEKGRLWVGTRQGLNQLDPLTRQFKRLMPEAGNALSLSGEFITTLYNDRDGRLWVGTREAGLNVTDDGGGTFGRYRADANQPDTLANDMVLAVHQDRSGRFWVGTNGGLCGFRMDTGRFRVFTHKDGLPNDTVLGILEDRSGRLWMSTNRGLSVLDPVNITFRNYDSLDGLQSNEFNSGAAFQSPSGEMFFGGVRGFNAFFPEQITDNAHVPEVVITHLLLENRGVQLSRDDKDSPLVKPIEFTDRLVLDHRQNLVTFEFAALHYARPLKNQYKYRLVDHDDHWITTGADKRFATYSNLDPGEYRFEVMGANKDGVWNPEPRVLMLKIKSPPWGTWWARSGYVLLGLLLVAWYLRGQREKLERQRRVAELERATSSRLREVDKLKDEFLANTSHELRSPLNGMIGLAESLMDGVTGPLPEATRMNLAMIVSGGRRLVCLVNDILDFSKMRNRSLSLNLASVDIRALTDVVLTLSNPLVGNKNLRLINDIDKSLPYVRGDEDRLQQIMHNLVGNAIKFTEAGFVRVSARVMGERMLVEVADTGVGISEKKQADIFEAFEQIDSGLGSGFMGTGLGLAVSKRLVELHGGELSVTSKLGSGSTFFFTLPTSQEAPISSSWSLTRVKASFLNAEAPVEKEESAHEQPRGHRILVVDDDPVNRRVLVNHLSLRNYKVTEAGGGKEALKLLTTDMPDLVVLDIMMPGMTGYEVCRTLRRRFSVRELPIIFLTAKNQITDLVAGFDAGGNDFLSKPVAKEELLTRIQTHLQLLEANRNLETKVAERTRKLERKNEDILKAREQAILQRKMTALGTLTAGVAHELRNPLNFVCNMSTTSRDLFVELESQLQTGDQRLDRHSLELLADLRENARMVHEYGVRANFIVEKMLDFSSTREVNPVATNLNELVGKYAEIAYREVQEKIKEPVVEFCLDLDDDVAEVLVAPQRIRQVLEHLIDNAMYALREKNLKQVYDPELRVETCHLGQEGVEIRVWDNGSGIPRDQVAGIFTPFFSTKDSQPVRGRYHIGLGLSICYDIVVGEHGGRIRVDSEEGHYTEMVVTLPYENV